MSCRNLATIMEVMAASGATPEMMAAAATRISEQDEARRAEIRELARLRKQRQRERQKEANVTDVTRDMVGQSVTPRDERDLETSPPVSPLFPSPTPLTNNPPLSPPTVEVSRETASKPKRKAQRLPADWTLPIEFIEFARAHRDPNHPNDQLTDEEIEREGHNIRDWSANTPNGAKVDWFAAWRGWIRRATAEILRARPRANGSARAVPSSSRRPATTSQFAPDVSLFDALALAGAAASDARADAGRDSDQRNGSGETRRLASVEVLDRGDARGTDARRTAGDRSGAGAVVLPLSAAGVR